MPEQAIDGFGQLAFPEAVLQLAAGFGEAGGQALQFRASGERRSRGPKRVRFIGDPENTKEILPAGKMAQ